MTPLCGTGWLIGEDFLDSKVVRRVEDATQSRFLIGTVRVALSPVRGGPMCFTESRFGTVPHAMLEG